MESKNRQTLNPWVSIWTKPRATIQQIVDTDPKHLVLVLVAIAGFAHALDRAGMSGSGDRFEWPMIILVAAIIGSIMGMVAYT